MYWHKKYSFTIGKRIIDTVMDVDVKHNSSTYCRICASSSQLFSVFETRNGLFPWELISLHLNIHIVETDQLSTRMCENCAEKLWAFHDYYESCNKVQEMITKWNFKEDRNKEIPVSEMAPVNFCMVKDNVKNEIKVEHGDDDNSCPPFDDGFTDDNGHCSKSEEDPPLAKIKEVKPRKPRKNIGKSSFCREKVCFECHICKLDCVSWAVLSSHTSKHHQTSALAKCKLCNATLKSRTTLYAHMKDHNSPSAFTCDKCPKICKSKMELDKHLHRHMPVEVKQEIIFKCDKCPKVTKSKENMKSHMIVHIPIEERKKHACKLCNLKFTTPQSVNSHLKAVHLKIKNRMCDECGYKCGTSNELRQHQAIHSDARPHVCKVCSKGFKTDTNLRVHMESHSDVGHNCQLCNKVLSSRKTYLRHMNYVHSDTRNHVCGYCNIAFKRRETLKTHMNSHTGVKPIQCKWCKERFMYWASYRSHKLRHHPHAFSSKQTAATAFDDKLPPVTTFVAKQDRE